MNDIQSLTNEAFDDAVAGAGIVLVDFWAAWCHPCRVMAPELARAADMRPQYQFAKVDVDEQPALAARFGIRSIPTLLAMRDGKPVAAQSGVVRAEQLVEALDRFAATDSEPAKVTS